LQDIRLLLNGSTKPRPSISSDPSSKSQNLIPKADPTLSPPSPSPVISTGSRGIFTSLTIYINGSTAPLVSDHKLKQLLTQHGANVSIGLARRSVTHVILGTANTRSGDVRRAKGAGGGLAATKIQKEIETVRGKGVKFVKAEW
jgi:hypothetical protein